MKKEYSVLKALALVLTIVTVVSLAVFSAYSWYDRTQRAEETGYLLSYTQTGRVNNTKGISVETFAGSVQDGEIIYSETALMGAVDVTAGKLNYFKTVITDSQNAGGAVVSLYLKDFAYNKDMGEKIYIGLVNPEKTYKEYTGALNGTDFVIDTLCLEDNIVVSSNGTVEVYWFVKATQSFSGTQALNPGTMCIAYN